MPPPAPGGDPARCHTLASGLPQRVSPGPPGADGPVSAGSPGAPVTASSSPARVTGLVLSLAPGRCCSSSVGCMVRVRQCFWKRKGSRRRASEPGPARRGGRRSSALARAIGTPIRAKPANSPAHRCQKQSSAPRGTADDRELARVQRRTIGRTRQNTHRTINPPATRPRTSPRLSRARRGRFWGERLSPRWPQLRLPQQQGLAGVRQDTGAKQTSRPPPGSKFLRFRWGGREVNRQLPTAWPQHPTCRRGPAPHSRLAQGAHDRGGCLRSRQNQGNKGRDRHGQHNAAGSGAACGQRRGAALGGQEGSPLPRQPPGRVAGPWQWGLKPAWIFLPGPKPTEPPWC